MGFVRESDYHMAKLRDIAKGTRAVKVVPFRPANAPPLPVGKERDEHTIDLGVRVLTGSEIAMASEAAQASAKAAGVATWLDTNPLCQLHEWAQTIVLACVDVDSSDRAEPFFVSVKEMLDSPAVGGENIAYLFQQQRAWEDECRAETINVQSADEVIAFIVQEAERPESDAGPFSLLRPASQRTLVHSMAVLCSSLLTARSLTSSQGEASTPDSSKSQESETDDDAGAADEGR